MGKWSRYIWVLKYKKERTNFKILLTLISNQLFLYLFKNKYFFKLWHSSWTLWCFEKLEHNFGFFLKLRWKLETYSWTNAKSRMKQNYFQKCFFYSWLPRYDITKHLYCQMHVFLVCCQIDLKLVYRFSSNLQQKCVFSKCSDFVDI